MFHSVLNNGFLIFINNKIDQTWSKQKAGMFVFIGSNAALYLSSLFCSSG